MSLFRIVLDERPFCFVHIPKTGGTSIRQGRQSGPAAFYRPLARWETLPSFAVIRDPFARIASCWRDFRFLRRATTLDLSTFCMVLPTPREAHYDARWQAAIRNPTTIEHHAAPQQHPIHGLDWADSLLRYETLDQDWDAFCRLHLLAGVPLPRRRSTHGFARGEWSEQAIAHVREVYAEDFERLGYDPSRDPREGEAQPS